MRTAFSFIDAGCDTAIGVDGEIEMINKAKRLDIEGQYILSDLLDYKPKKSGFST